MNRIGAGIRIAIVGAGPGGLALARLLQVQGLRPTIYERDASATARPQGGSLDLHQEDGLLAVREAGLYNQFLKHARFEGQQTRILDKYANLLLDDKDVVGPDHKDARPEIDRKDLRDILLSSLLPNTTQWGRTLESVAPALGGGHALTFRDGHTEAADLVVGADGAWSKVRASALTDALPSYTGYFFVDAAIPNVDTRYPAVGNLVGQGSAFVLGDGKVILPQRNGGGILRVYFAKRGPEEDADVFARDVLSRGTVAVRDALLEHYAGWAPDILDIVRACEGADIVVRKIFSFPPSHSWPRTKGVTLLGDAAHVMTPFSGAGVNMALADAMDLAAAIRRIVAGGTDLGTALEEYEKKIMARAEEHLAEGTNFADIAFSHDAAERMSRALNTSH